MISAYREHDEPIPGYRLIKRLGKGSYGEVWQAEAPGEVLVALKIISNLNGIYAIREWQSLQAVKNLNHPNLLEIHGVWLKNEEGRVLSRAEIDSLIPEEVAPQLPPKPRAQSSSGAGENRRAAARASWAGANASTAGNAARYSGTMNADEGDQPEAGGTEADDPAALAAQVTVATSSDTGTSGGTGAPSSSDSSSGTGSRDASASSAASKWQRMKDRVPPLQLISAMSLGAATLLDRLHDSEKTGHTGIPRDDLLHHMQGAAEGLHYLNERDVLHCDIKPENLLLVGGSVKVCDYGSALPGIMAAETTEQKGFTKIYAAPEQLLGKRVKLHKTTDQYALAITYYALRTGKYPWPERIHDAEITEIKQNEGFDLSALKKLTKYPFETLVLRRALSRNPDDRFETVREFVGELTSAAARERELITNRWRRRFQRVAIAAVVLLLIAAGLAVYFSPSDTDYEKLLVQVDQHQLENLDTAIALTNQSSELRQTPERTVPNLLELIGRLYKTEREKALQQVGGHLDEYWLSQPAFVTGMLSLEAARAEEGELKSKIDKGQYEVAIKSLADEPLEHCRLGEPLRERCLTEWLEKEDALAAQALAGAGASDGKRLAERWRSLVAAFPAKQTFVETHLAATIDRLLEQSFAHVTQTLASGGQTLQQTQHAFDFLGILAGASESAANAARQKAQARIGGLAVGCLLQQPESELAARWGAISSGDMEVTGLRPSYELLRRAVSPDTDPALLDASFFADFGAKFSEPWQKHLLDRVVDRSFKASERPDVWPAIKDSLYQAMAPVARGKFPLLMAHATLLDARQTGDAAAAAVKAKQQLADENVPAEHRLAQRALLAWCDFLQSEADVSQALMKTVAAFQMWKADAESLDDIPRQWFVEFVTVAVPRVTAGTDVCPAIDLLTTAGSEAPGVRPLSAETRELELLLREARVLTLAQSRDLNAAGFAEIKDHCQLLIGERPQRLTAGELFPLRRPDLLIDALYVESRLAHQALSATGPLKGTEARAAADQQLVATSTSDAVANLKPDEQEYVRFVSELVQGVGQLASRERRRLLTTADSPNPWLHDVPVRRRLAARLLDWLVTGWPDLSGGELAERGPQFLQSVAPLEAARSWAPPGSPERAKGEAKLAVALYYGSSRPSWKAVAEHANVALSDLDTLEQTGDKQLVKHVRLAGSQAALESGATDAADQQRAVHALAELLGQECDPFGKRGAFSDRELLERMVQPALKVVNQAADSDAKFDAADLAAIHGSLGAILERDTQRILASRHFDFVIEPERVFREMRQAFETASRLDNDRQRRIRWLLGAAFAADQQTEIQLMRSPELDEAAEFVKLVATLDDLAKQAESINARDFAAAALRGLAQYYRNRDVEDLRSRRTAFESAQRDFQTALAGLKAHPLAASPWCQSWRAILLETCSIASIEQSWGGTSWKERGDALQQALDFGQQAKDIPAEFRVDPTRVYFAIANAYEDFALKLHCLPAYGDAQTTFESVTDAITHDPFRLLKASLYVWRVRFRRMIYDPRAVAAEAVQWKERILEEVTGIVVQARQLGYESFARDADHLLAQIQLELFHDYASAEKIYVKLAAQSAGQKKAKYLKFAISSVVPLLEPRNRQLPDAATARERGRRYLTDWDALRAGFTTAEDWVHLFEYRSVFIPDTATSLDQRFTTLRTQIDETLKKAPLASEVEMLRLRIGFAMLLGGEPCSSDSLFSARMSSLADAGRLLQAATSFGEEERLRKLNERWTLEGYAWLERKRQVPAAQRAECALKAETAFLAAIEQAQKREQVLGEALCCDGVTQIRGYRAATRTKALRKELAHLSKDIAVDRRPVAERRAALQRIDGLLKETEEQLPDAEKGEIINLRGEVNQYQRGLR